MSATVADRRYRGRASAGRRRTLSRAQEGRGGSGAQIGRERVGWERLQTGDDALSVQFRSLGVGVRPLDKQGGHFGLPQFVVAAGDDLVDVNEGRAPGPGGFPAGLGAGGGVFWAYPATANRARPSGNVRRRRVEWEQFMDGASNSARHGSSKSRRYAGQGAPPMTMKRVS